MNFIEYLKDPDCSKKDTEYAVFEYRLLCSGELYNGRVITTDWRKSEGSRFLLEKPFELTIVSQPFEDYPQEISLRFKAFETRITKDKINHDFFPDDEIAQDICSFLCLLFRRLITVAAKVREQFPKEPGNIPDVIRDWPFAFVNSIEKSFWAYKKSTVVFGSKGIEKITDYNPYPKEIDPVYVEGVFRGIADSIYLEPLIYCVRLYSLALELLESRPEFAYQLLISCIETISSSVYSEFEPSDEEKLDIKTDVLKKCIDFGLSEEKAGRIAILACKGHSWSFRKFKKFLVEFADDNLWKEDDLFRHFDPLTPNRDNYEAAIGKIYKMRNKSLHAGRPYPLSAKVGSSPTVPAKLFLELGESDPFPPVTWFERSVNLCLTNFIHREIGN